MGEEAKPEQAQAEAKPEEKKEAEKTEVVKAEEEAKPPSPLILYVDLHCVGCAKKIERSILRIRGVEGVVMDMAQNQVTIKGVVEPQAVCTKIMKKTKRNAKVLSPLPSAEGEPLPQLVASQVSGLTTVELNVNMHCEPCALQLKKKILQMKGVTTVETDLSSSKVMVTGTMDAEHLVHYVYRRTKKQAKIVPHPEPPPTEEPKSDDKKEPEKPAEDPKPKEKKEEEAPPSAAENPPPEEEKKEEGGGDGNKEEKNEVNIEEASMQKMMYYYQPMYVIERIPAPQLFSDENPNACCIS